MTFIVVCCALLSGCKESRPPGVDLQGTVTWQGKPIPTGFVIFSPDATKGGSGHQGMAPIKGGRYDTREEGGRWVSFGPQVVMIAGFDSPSPSASQPRGVRLFKPHEQNVEITKESRELNLVVPDTVPRLKPVAGEEF